VDAATGRVTGVTAAALSMLAVTLIAGARRARPTRTFTPVRSSRARRPPVIVLRVGVAVSAACAWLVDPILVIGAVFVALCGPRLIDRARRRRAQHLVDAALPDSIEMLILNVYAGMTPHQAIGVLAERAPHPIRFAYAEVRRRIERGAPLADAVVALPDLVGAQAVAVADILTIAERNGAPIALMLEQLTVDVRERRRRHAEAAARSLPVKMSFPLVMCTLPAFVLVAIVPAVLAALRSLGGAGL
jgi:tight adherence protein C